MYEPERHGGCQLPPSHRSTRWTPAARASRRTAALVHVRTCTPSPPGTPRLPSARAPTASYVPRAGAAVPAGQAMAMREREIDFEGPTVHGSELGVSSKGTAGSASRRGKRSGDWRGTLTICGNHDRTNPIQRSETPRGGRYFIYRPPPDRPPRLRPGQCHWQHGRLTAASMSSPQSGSPRRVLQLPMEMVRLSAASIASIDAVDAGGARISTDGCTSTRSYLHTIAQPCKPPGLD